MKHRKVKQVFFHQAPVAHTYNPSYAGCRDQDRVLKPAQGNSSRDTLEKGLVEQLKV
jgi:hypothetical protein